MSLRNLGLTVGLRQYLGALMGTLLDLVSEAGVEVVNATGGTLTKGTLVYVSGWHSGFDKPSIAKADYADPAKQATLVLLEDVADKNKVVASPRAYLGGQTTTGATAGVSPWYLSTTLGAGTVTAKGADTQRVGTVKTAHATNGYVWFDIRPLAVARPLTKRFGYVWTAGEHGQPALNAVLALDENSNAAAHLAFNVADKDFEVLGTNAVTADVTANAEGGLTIATHGAATDSTIILPHLDTNQTGWSTTTWGTDQETHWACRIKTGAAVINETIWLGLKLTNTPVIATDDDQAFFRINNAGTAVGTWKIEYSIGGTDTEVDTAIVGAASTEMLFEIKIDASRIARFYINGTLYATSTALTTAKDLIPYVGILSETSATAKSMVLYGESISRLAA